MNPVIKREWGAALFVATVVLGALVVGIAFIIGAGHQPAVAQLPPCPSYTPYVVTPKAAKTSTTTAVVATPTVAATATAFNIATVNCPTAPLPPTPTSTPTASSTSTPVITPSPAPTPAATPGVSASAIPSPVH